MNDTTASHPETCSAATAQQSYVQSFDAYRLIYFDGRGLAEPIRTLFATAGLFPGFGFEDVRLTRAEFDARRDQGDLAKNLNRVPVLNHNGVVIGQSNAILRYLARRFGLMGDTEVEAAQIDAMTEHIADVKASWRKLFPYKKELSAEQVEANDKKWFDTPAMPALEGRAERQLQWFLGNVETMLPGTGYSVGGRPSLADAMLYNLLGEHADVEDTRARGPFGSLAKTKAVLEQFPKLQSVVEIFRQSPGMQHYLGTRGKVKW